MLRYVSQDGSIQELDPKNRDDVIKIVKENMISSLVFDEANAKDAEVLLDQVRKIFGRTSETSKVVCNELEKMRAFDLEF